MAHKTDEQLIAESHNNIPRFCVDWPQVTLVLLVLCFLWGYLGWSNMPQRKDPDVPVRQAVAVCDWPGATAEQTELQCAYIIEQAMSQNGKVKRTWSLSTTGNTNVTVELADATKSATEEWSDINLKLNSINTLPKGAGPIQFNSGFGDTAALMLTVASPMMTRDDLGPRAHSLETAIKAVRKRDPKAAAGMEPFTIVLNFPTSVNPRVVAGPARMFQTLLAQHDIASDVKIVEGPGYVAFDGVTKLTDQQLIEALKRFVQTRLQTLQLHPDAWEPAVIRDTATTIDVLASVAGSKYSYRELDDFTDQLQRGFRSLEIVSKVLRSGVLQQTVYLDYSQQRLAAYGLKPSQLPDLLSARNITMSGGQISADNTMLTVYPSGQITEASQISDMLMTLTSNGTPVYLRDLVTVIDGYQDPPDFLTFLVMPKDPLKPWSESNPWTRLRAVTLALQMKSHQQINEFGVKVDALLETMRKSLPKDLILDKTSNQPAEVSAKVDLLMTSLWKAIVLVVLVSLIGFWDWRSALLMALSIPITLSMTFGMMWMLGIDIQQVSIATLIIALGLLVDDPVVAGDAIKHGMGEGMTRKLAAWLGPTKLAAATTFATITNIVAYLPFLGITGDTGEFLYSLPVVMTCALVASRIASMTFVPYLGSVMLRPVHEPPIEVMRTQGFYSYYVKLVTVAIHHRWKSLALGAVFLAVGMYALTTLPTQFFPTDLNPLFYVDVWAPENCSLVVTNQAAHKAEEIIQATAKEFTDKHHLKQPLLHSIASYVGGGSPRFWNTLSPQQQQLNYAQVTVNLTNEEFTTPLVDVLQEKLAKAVPGVTMDVRQLQTGKPIDMPVQIRILGEHIPTLRKLSAQLKDIFRSVPVATRIRDDWGAHSFSIVLDTSNSRANMSGFTNYDVASSSMAGLTGTNVGTMRVGHKVIPISTRMQVEERSQLSDVDNMYVFSQENSNNVPLGQISTVDYKMQTSRIQRRWQHRCITVGAFPEPGHLPSEVINAAWPQLEEFRKNMPTGYEFYMDGEQRQQTDGFKNLVVVMFISIVMIYMSLVFQFKDAVKPFVVAAAVPFGLVGAVYGLMIMNTPFGFMSMLGIISLMGVIVSHIIVLFDYIEEAHAKGEDFESSIIDAGIMRLRPVMITVGATITALFPLATDGGPLWQPLCYAQIGGLFVATFVTLLIVPVIYTTFVTDLKWVKWEQKSAEEAEA